MRFISKLLRIFTSKLQWDLQWDLQGNYWEYSKANTSKLQWYLQWNYWEYSNKKYKRIIIIIWL